MITILPGSHEKLLRRFFEDVGTGTLRDFYIYLGGDIDAKERHLFGEAMRTLKRDGTLSPLDYDDKFRNYKLNETASITGQQPQRERKYTT